MGIMHRKYLKHLDSIRFQKVNGLIHPKAYFCVSVLEKDFGLNESA